MAIRVVHQPTAASAGAAYATGYGRRRGRRQKYMLDMFQRNRYQQQRLGALGGRGVRRGAVGAGDLGGRWLEHGDVGAAQALIGHAKAEGRPAAREDRRTLVQRKAQMRRDARRARLGMAPIDYGMRGVKDLRPKWQSAAEVQAEEEERIREEDRQHDIDMLGRREDAKRSDFGRLDPQEQNDANQSIAADIFAVPQEGDPIYTPKQQAKAKGISESDHLSPEEKNTALKKILMDPQGEPKQSPVDVWKSTTAPFDRTTLEPLPEGTEGDNVIRLPIDDKGNLDEGRADKIIGLRDALNPDTSEADAKAQEAQEKAAKEQQAEIEKLKDKEEAAKDAVTAVDVKIATGEITPALEKALNAEKKNKEEALKRIQDKLAEFEQGEEAAPAEAGGMTMGDLPAGSGSMFKSVMMSDDEWNKAWNALPEGGVMPGKDGQPYLKNKRYA